MRISRVLTLAATLSLMLTASASAAPVGALKQYRIPTADSQPRYITNGSDGNRWFTESSDLAPQIGRITPAGDVTEFAVPCSFCLVNDIAQGPNDTLYFTTNDAVLGRITASGAVDFIPSPAPAGGNIAVDSAHGAVWITDFNSHVIWRYDIATDQFTSPISTPTPTDVAVGANGDVWFTDNDSPGAIGHYDGQSTTMIPTNGGIPTDITVASDGDVWFVEAFSQAVGRLDPSSNAVTEFPVPGVGPQNIAPAPDGSVWFTQATKDNAARITDDGTITETKVVRKSDPFGITVDAQGNPWYTLRAANKIAEFQLR
jgi:streptogramin lyase